MKVARSVTLAYSYHPFQHSPPLRDGVQGQHFIASWRLPRQLMMNIAVVCGVLLGGSYAGALSVQLALKPVSNRLMCIDGPVLLQWLGLSAEIWRRGTSSNSTEPPTPTAATLPSSTRPRLYAWTLSPMIQPWLWQRHAMSHRFVDLNAAIHDDATDRVEKGSDGCQWCRHRQV